MKNDGVNQWDYLGMAVVEWWCHTLWEWFIDMEMEVPPPGHQGEWLGGWTRHTFWASGFFQDESRAEAERLAKQMAQSNANNKAAFEFDRAFKANQMEPDLNPRPLRSGVGDFVSVYCVCLELDEETGDFVPIPNPDEEVPEAE